MKDLILFNELTPKQTEKKKAKKKIKKKDEKENLGHNSTSLKKTKTNFGRFVGVRGELMQDCEMR